MALPKKLKNMNLFFNGVTQVGEVESVTLPKLTRKSEKHRGGGMSGAVGIDMGLDDDALKMEFSLAGYPASMLRTLGIPTASGVPLRFVGALQRDGDGSVDAVEVTLSGRVTEIDRGEYKPGDNNSAKVMVDCTYYKETLNGTTLIEIDVINMIEIVDGVDRLASQRRALGM